MMTAKKTTRKRAERRPETVFPIVREGFSGHYGPGDYYLRQILRDAPSCWNGSVEVERYRVTVERIVEPPEVLAERVRQLMRKSDNWHDVEHLQKEARRHGFDLDLNEHGADTDRKKNRGW